MKITISISKEAHDYIKLNKKIVEEPIYKVVDRLLKIERCKP